MPPPRNAFIAFTPYHVFLSSILALDEARGEENRLLIMSDFADAGRFADTLKGWSESPFSEVLTLPGAFGARQKLLRQVRYRQNIARVARLFRKQQVSRVFVGNDQRPEAQAALHVLRRYRPRVIFVEDGLSAYHSARRRPVHPIVSTFARAAFGRHWEDVGVLGTSRWIDEVRALHPEMLRPELVVKPAKRVSPEAACTVAIQRLSRAYLDACGVRVDMLGRLDTLVSVVHSDVAHALPGYRDTIERVVESLLEGGARIGVKYHPREYKEDFLALDRHGVTLLPRGFPVEMVFTAFPGRFRTVVGDVSTVLLTARWLDPTVQVASLAPILGYTDEGVLTLFRHRGIMCLEDARQLDALALGFNGWPDRPAMGG